MHGPCRSRHARKSNDPRFRAGPGINVAFPDLISEGDVWLQALVAQSMPHKSSARGASAPMCAWWMMTAGSNPNGPTIGIIIWAGAGHRLPPRATCFAGQPI
jgi:hypothetical protein